MNFTLSNWYRCGSCRDGELSVSSGGARGSYSRTSLAVKETLFRRDSALPTLPRLSVLLMEDISTPEKLDPRDERDHFSLSSSDSSSFNCMEASYACLDTEPFMDDLRGTGISALDRRLRGEVVSMLTGSPLKEAA